MIGRRLHWAWHLRVWPWMVPAEIMRWCVFPCRIVVTDGMRAHAETLKQGGDDDGA